MKRLFRLLLAVLIIIGAWFFLIKENQQEATYKSSLPSGVLYDHLLQWAIVLPQGVDSVRTVEKTPYREIRQVIYAGAEPMDVSWEVESLTDSTSNVHGYFNKAGSDFKQRLKILFGQSDIPGQSRAITQHIANTLQTKNQGFAVGSIGDTLVPEKFVAYISVQSTVRNKARDMIYSIGDVMSYIKKNDIPLDGDPFLEVTSWDRSSDRISFDFNFPIKLVDSLPESPLVKFKTVPALKAMHVPFYGNYRISDISWYQLLAHAQLKEIEVEQLPVEIYRNDPHMGGNELEWRADVMLPYR